MKLALKTCPTFDQTGLAMMEELSFHTTKLYNIANHRCREEGFVSYKLLEKELKPNWHRASTKLITTTQDESSADCFERMRD